MLITERRLFIPNAVFIPTKEGKEGRDFDRTDCTLATWSMGNSATAKSYTEEAWRNGSEASYVQRRGDFFLNDDTEIPTGRVQLLPDACVVKIPDRDYWCDDVQAMTKQNLRRLRPWTVGSTFTSANCVAPTNSTTSSISTKPPTKWTRTRTSETSCTN